MMSHPSGVHGLTLRRCLSGRVSPFSVAVLGVQFRRNIVPPKRSVSRVFLLSVHKNVGPVTVNAVTGPTCRRGDGNHSAALGRVMSAGTTHLSKSSSLMPPTVRADSRRLMPLW